MKNIYLLVSQGNVHRDLIRLGMLGHLLEAYPGVRVVLLTQAWNAPDFLAEVRHERVEIRRHDLFRPDSIAAKVINLRRMARSRTLIDLAMRLETKVASVPDGLEEVAREYPPSLVVTTHPKMIWEWDVVTWARRRRVPTVGIVKSWDNVLKKPFTRTDRVAVWGKANVRDAIDEDHYRRHEVEMVGAPGLDRYFTQGVIRERDEFWRTKGLDPAKPIIFFGTAGGVGADWDETFLMDYLLELTATHPELREAQIVCRLHPISHLEHFWSYREHPRVILSFGSYVKTLGWSMTRDEVDEMANMLCHSDVVITPASTLSLEAPCFDTPTIVTFFSTVRPDHAAAAARRYWLDLHFKRIRDNGWLPLAWSPEDLLQILLRSLQEPSWYREGRRKLVDEFVTFTDGRSFARVAQFIAGACGAAPDRRDQ